MTDFTDLGLAAPLLRALAAEGYSTPTPIQVAAIPAVLAGRDVQGIAQTGTGKTAAFALPILDRLMADPAPRQPRAPRALVLSPTRELAAQIAERFRAYGRQGNLRTGLVFGGVPKGRQISTLAQGLDVLVATPGRLLDLMNERAVVLDAVRHFVLDEADHMLDLGFIAPIRRIAAKLPKRRQSLFFSATMPKEIAALAAELLTDPAHVAVTPPARTADRIEQSVVFVEAAAKRALLTRMLRAGRSDDRTLVFTRTKHGADRVVKHLEASGQRAAAIHGNKSQSQRERALAAFRDGSVPTLVATDIAARGIDVEGVETVINFDLPNVPESYVHRIGRTARAGRAGIAISFCDTSERGQLRDIETLLRVRLPVAAADKLAA